MAGKKVSSQNSEFSAIHYNVETRSLLFTAKGQGKSLLFTGVPADLFYGMPSGMNVRNFIDLKLRGRYSMVELNPPPVISYSALNREVSVYMHDGTELIYKPRAGEPTSFGSDAHSAFAIFQETYGRRTPDQTRKLRTHGVGAHQEPEEEETQPGGPDNDLGLPEM
jgi:hypothetical protein